MQTPTDALKLLQGEPSEIHDIGEGWSAQFLGESMRIFSYQADFYLPPKSVETLREIFNK